MASANSIGGRFPASLPNQSPFKSETEAFDEGLRLLCQLQVLRGYFSREPDNTRCDELVREYCSRLRRSPTSIPLVALQRSEHLADPWIVAVLYVLSGLMGFRPPGRTTECAVLAVGTDLGMQRWFLVRLQRSRGPGRLFSFTLDKGLMPSQVLLNKLTRWTLISNSEAEEYKRDLAEWPTKRGIEDLSGDEDPVPGVGGVG